MPEPAERWARDAGGAEIATLHIPASTRHRRVFEIDVRFLVRTAADAVSAWHALSVELNGAKQWQRRIATSNLGQTDSLDYRCRRELGVGQALRVRAIGQVGGAVRVQLLIEAEEQ